MKQEEPRSQNAALILAAGESKRLGHPKQLVLHQGKSLIRHAVIKSSKLVDRIVVVTGAFADSVIQELTQHECEIAHNDQWHRGLGSSIACGVNFISNNYPACQWILLQLCDQVFIPTLHLSRLITSCQTGETISATRYPDGDSGIPACFPKRYLPLLTSLNGRSGAKSLIQNSGAVLWPCEKAAIDIDVPADLAKLDPT